jgi:hypothetical protein
MPIEIPIKRIPYTNSRLHHARTSAHAESSFVSASPVEGGEIVSRIQCGNVVANVYRHSEDPNFGFTVAFEREFLQDGKLVRSARLTADDLGALRKLAPEAFSAMANGLHDPSERQRRQDHWQQRQDAKKPTEPRR